MEHDLEDPAGWPPTGARARRTTVGELDRAHRARLATEREAEHQRVDEFYDARLVELEAGMAQLEREVEGLRSH